MNKKLLKLVKETPGWLSEKEALFLEERSQQTHKLIGEIVEIGSFHGKSTLCLAQGKGRVYAIDPHEGYVENGKKYKPTYHSFKKSIKNANASRKIVPIVKTSQDAAKNWNKKIRFLFIDGLHDFENASLDYKLWSKYLVDGGIVAVHDSFMRWCGSEKVAVDRIVNSSSYYKIGAAGSIIYGVKGKGNAFDKILKFAVRIWINSVMQLNHIKIVLFNAPKAIKTRLFPRYNIVL